MRINVDRREVLSASLLAIPAFVWPAKSETSTAIQAALAGLEARTRGRLGIAAVDLSTGRQIRYRANERFPMCSTFKLLLIAMILSRVDVHRDLLERRIILADQDFVRHAPVTQHHKGPPGMTLQELCEAAIVYSDGTAANVLLAQVGGAAGLTAWLRAQGDPVTRLDRIEMALNQALEGDLRDTTTPAAMLEDVRKIVLGSLLSVSSRVLLTGWLVASKTGERRIRGGLPAGWRAADKTGTGDNGTVNDVAVLWPAGGGPLVVAAYLTQSRLDDSDSEAILAAVGKLMVAEFSRSML